jgi:hypothetical protein
MSKPYYLPLAKLRQRLPFKHPVRTAARWQSLWAVAVLSCLFFVLLLIARC